VTGSQFKERVKPWQLLAGLAVNAVATIIGFSLFALLSLIAVPLINLIVFLLGGS